MLITKYLLFLSKIFNMTVKNFPDKKIVDIINRSGYTQLFISEKIDVNNAYLSCVLSNKRKLSKKMRRKLVEFIEIHVNLMGLKSAS